MWTIRILLFGVLGLFGWALQQVWRTLGVWPWDRRYLKGLAAAGVGAAATLLAHKLLPVPGAPGVVLLLAVSFGVFLGVLGMAGADAEDRDVAGGADQLNPETQPQSRPMVARDHRRGGHRKAEHPDAGRRPEEVIGQSLDYRAEGTEG